MRSSAERVSFVWSVADLIRAHFKRGAAICLDKDGNPEPDADLRDTENVPLEENVDAYFDREVRPHVPGAWVNTSVRGPKDGKVGRVGYEISFNRFYKFQPSRPLEESQADIRAVKKEILSMFAEVAR